MVASKNMFSAMLAILAMMFMAGCSGSSGGSSAVSLDGLSIKAAVYDDNGTVEPEDDSLSIYFDQSIDINATKDEISDNFDISGTGKLGDLVIVEYNDALLHRLKITLDANSTQFISGDTISFANASRWEGLFAVDKTPVIITSPKTVVTVVGSRTYTEVNGTVTDDATGLIWEETGDTQGDWNTSKIYCEALDKDGLTWRLPTIDELIALSDKTVSLPAVDSVFTSTLPNQYWTGSEYLASSEDDIWTVNFNTSNTNVSDKNETRYVRCVSSEETTSTSSYTRDNVNEVVLDASTNLMWQDDATTIDTNDKKTYDGAIDKCTNSGLAGYADWRLPDINELDSVTDKNTASPAMSSEFQNKSSAKFWSSTKQVDNSKAWYIYFLCGCSGFQDITITSQVRCVRSVD